MAEDVVVNQEETAREDTKIDENVEPVEREDVDAEEGFKIISEARENLEVVIAAEGDYRDSAIEDLNFRVGKQWPDAVKNSRDLRKQPCLQFNLIPKFVRQVTGDARQNVPGINVVPENSLASKEVAEVLKGVIRYIEHDSVASYIYSKGLDQSAAAGRGFWRVDCEYEDDESFNQIIKILPIANPLAVYFDPVAVGPCYENAQWCIVRQWMAKKQFERENPGKSGEAVALDGMSGNQTDWYNNSAVCIAEYWRKEPIEEELLEVQVFPKALDAMTPAPPAYVTVITKKEMLEKFSEVNIAVLRKRTIKRAKVVCYTITGTEVLYKREWPGRFIPIIPVLGEELNVDGKDYLSGIIRDMKDPQRAYNYWMTMMTEQVALAPKVPWLVTDAMIAPYLTEWDNINETNYPYLRYKPDPAQAGGPQRPTPPQLSQGYAQMLQIAQGALNDTSGIFKPALGQESNETSGRAILARQKEGDTGSYVYIANWLLSVQYTGKVIVDLIPKVLDSERIAMILDEKGDMQQVPINQQFTEPGSPGINKIYDVRQGKYGVRVTSGPSYATKRQESANSMLEFIRIYPQAAPVVGDKLARMMDWEGAEEIADRLEAFAQRQGFLAPPGPIPGMPGQPQPAPTGNPVAGPAAQEMGIDQLLAQTGPQVPVI